MAASCYKLKSLEMHFGSEDLEAHQDGNNEGIIFPRFEILHLDDRSEAGYLPQAILSSTFPSLQSISVNQTQLLDTDIHQMVDHVKAGSPHLIKLWVRLKREPICLETLRSLSWHSLTALSVYSSIGWEINDEDLKNLVRGLPQLEFLDLSTKRVNPLDVGGFQSGLTVRSLVSLAQHCTMLRLLNVTVKACDLDLQGCDPIPAAIQAYRTGPEERPPTLSAEQLSLVIHLRSRDDMEPTAAFLTKMCPRVQSLDFDVYLEGLGGLVGEEFAAMFLAQRVQTQYAVFNFLMSMMGNT